MNLEGKTVLITGASGGIGRATADALARAGSKLLLTALEREDLDRITGELTTGGATVTARAANLLDSGDRRELLEWIGDQAPLDVLVNNAGIGHYSPFAASDWDDIERVSRLVASVPTWLIHSLLPSLLDRPEAAIVNVSSASARIPYPGLAVYAASKAFLSSLSQTLATELDDSNVRVLCLHPGFVQTDFFEAAGMDMRHVPTWAISSPEKVAKRIVRMLETSDPWAYSDLATPIELGLAATIPHRIRPKVFRKLFWDLPPTGEAQPRRALSSSPEEGGHHE